MIATQLSLFDYRPIRQPAKHIRAAVPINHRAQQFRLYRYYLRSLSADMPDAKAAVIDDFRRECGAHLQVTRGFGGVIFADYVGSRLEKAGVTKCAACDYYESVGKERFCEKVEVV